VSRIASILGSTALCELSLPSLAKTVFAAPMLAPSPRHDFHRPSALPKYCNAAAGAELLGGHKLQADLMLL
jgi:hypothetical protein